MSVSEQIMSTIEQFYALKLIIRFNDAECELMMFNWHYFSSLRCFLFYFFFFFRIVCAFYLPFANDARDNHDKSTIYIINRNNNENKNHFFLSCPLTENRIHNNKPNNFVTYYHFWSINWADALESHFTTLQLNTHTLIRHTRLTLSLRCATNLN